MPGRTTFTVLEETAQRYGNAEALHQPTGSKEGPRYRTYTWNDWLRIARETAIGLRALGLKKGGIVCLLSETRAEFYLADIGIMAAGGVSGALYTAYPIAELARNVQTSAPDFLFIENAKTLAAISRAIEDQGQALPPHIILLTGEAPGALSFQDLQKAGREAEQTDPAAFERIRAEVFPEDPAVLYLTSGATGEPKMGITTHAALVSNIDTAPVVLPIGPEDSTVVFLPSAHIAQRIVLELVPMRMGTPVWFSESLARLPSELKAIKPTVFLAPPRVWERMYATICTEIRKRPAIARKIFYGALGLGMEAARLKQIGKPVPGWMSRALKIADRLVFTTVRERLGGRMRIAACGAAPLGKDLGEFFAAINLPLVEGFGLTEAGVLSFNPLDRPKPGSVGKLLPGVEARLTEEGELQVRTPWMFQGYYRDEAATRSVLTSDGWFSTGDIAEVDADGYWYITGRKKELIVSSNGKKIYPARIENLFKMEPIVNQVLLVGDKQPYITALLTVNALQAEGLKGMEDYRGRAMADLVQAPPVASAVETAVSRVNQHLADFERIRRFRVLEREFSIENGELTPTMKIRRGRVLENHRELVSALYLGKEESS
ncbi:MAG TPA: long-chain fatty acid--CoA ligase [Bryobacteraceae bacterium]|jgi:long-chain acyl-CoA synthetase|nr:long-chain fatty acid--CoA ligase [Bryobacteraceae bacterium]